MAVEPTRWGVIYNPKSWKSESAEALEGDSRLYGKSRSLVRLRAVGWIRFG